MTSNQADILLWLLGGHLLLFFIISIIFLVMLNGWLRRIWIRLDRIPKQNRPE